MILRGWQAFVRKRWDERFLDRCADCCWGTILGANLASVGWFEQGRYAERCFWEDEDPPTDVKGP